MLRSAVLQVGGSIIALITYVDRVRSPLSTEMYRRLGKMGHTLIEDKNIPKDFDNGNQTTMEGLESYWAHKRSNRYYGAKRVIKHMGDHYVFIKQMPQLIKNTKKGCIYTDYIPIGRETQPWVLEFIEWVHKFSPDAEVYPIEWGIDPMNYKCKKAYRTFKASYIGSANPLWPFHEARYAIVQTLWKMNDSSIYVNNVYGEKYKKALQNTQILVVEDSMRGYLTQKYLEGAVCGCMLLGVPPTGYDDIFIDGKTMVFLDSEAPLKSLVELIEYYHDNPKERERIAKRGRDKVLQHFSLDRVSQEVDAVLTG